MSEIARLKVTLDDVAPAVVRRVEVPLSIRLDDLHFVLQIVIGWQNCHPFEFRNGAQAWGLVDRDAEENPLPAEGATLEDLAALGPAFAYVYTFGEGWEHSVEIEAVIPAPDGAPALRLLSAEGRCPPADIGGPLDYETYLYALNDPKHLHHEAMRDFDDPDFDPHTVDVAALRSNLANLAKYLGRRKQPA